MSPQAFQKRERVRRIKETLWIAFGVFCFGIFVGCTVMLMEVLRVVVKL